MRSVMLKIPPEISDDEARLLMAMILFAQKKVSVGKAAEMAGYSKRTFMEILAHHQIPVVNYAIDEVEQDLLNA